MTSQALGTSRSAALGGLYAINIALTVAICVIAGSRYVREHDDENSFQYWAVGFADAQVSLGVALALLGPGTPMFRVALALGMIGGGTIANCALAQAESNATSVAQIGFASFVHSLLLTAALAPIAWRCRIGIVDPLLPLWGSATNAAPARAEADGRQWRQFGVREMMVWTLVCALVVSALRRTLGDFRWDQIAWDKALALSTSLWAQIAAVALLSLAVLAVGLSGFGSAPLVWCTLTGAAIAWGDATIHWFLGDSPENLRSEMILKLDLGRAMTLVANVAALRCLGLGLLATPAEQAPPDVEGFSDDVDGKAKVDGL